MARLPQIDPASSAATLASFRTIEASRGYVSNLLRCLLHSPAGARAQGEFGHYLRFGTNLTELQRELIICATVRGSPYGWAHHGGLLARLGLTDVQMADLKAGRVPDGLSDRERAIVDYTFEFTAGRGLSDEILVETRRHYSDQQIVDASLLSSYYIGAGALIAAFEPEIESVETLEIERAWQTNRPR